MATATKPQGAEAERLIFDWQNPAKFQVLFKIADDLREARERASLAWRDWRDTKYPRYARSAGDWSDELPDDDERVVIAKQSAEMAAETVRQFESDLGEWLGELREIRAYLRENAPQLECLVPLVRPGIAPPAESFEAMAERMVRLAGELAEKLGSGERENATNSPEIANKRQKTSDLMRAILEERSEASEWTIEQWCDATSRSRAAVFGTPTWKAIMAMRARLAAEYEVKTGRRVDHRRFAKIKPNK